MMKQLSSLILVAPLAACSTAAGGLEPDAGAGADDDGGAEVDAATPAGPDLSCLPQTQLPPPTTAVDPMVLAGRVVEFTTAGTTPVDGADVALFRAGQPVVLARTNSASNGAFATGAVITNGHAVHAYLKAMKKGYRTAFFYPPRPFTVNSTNVVVPTMSDAAFSTVRTLLGATQNDANNGALLVAILDCSDQPLAGATVSVRRGNSPVGTTHDLGTVVPTDDGVFLVFNVPDGKVRVSAEYQGTQFPEHDVVVRGQDQDCAPPYGTLTSTIVKPGA